MIERVGRRFGLPPRRRLAGDTAYDAVTLFKRLVDRQIYGAHPSVGEVGATDGTFSRADIVFDQERSLYVCPGGAELASTRNIDRPPLPPCAL